MEVWRVWFHGHPVFEHPEVFQQPTSLSQVGPSHLASGGHIGGKISASVDHAERKQSSTASHVDIVGKTGRSKYKLKFPFKLCEVDHLTHQFPTIAEVQRVWSKTQEFPSPEQPTQPLVDQVVEPISAFIDLTLILESDPDMIEPTSVLVNPTLPSESDFHEVVESIQPLINPTLILESEISASHIFFTTSSQLTKQGDTKLA